MSVFDLRIGAEDANEIVDEIVAKVSARLGEWQKCPVCDGRGVVPVGFYNPTPTGVSGFGTTNAVPENCRRCFGLGTLIRPKQEKTK